MQIHLYYQVLLRLGKIFRNGSFGIGLLTRNSFASVALIDRAEASMIYSCVTVLGLDLDTKVVSKTKHFARDFDLNDKVA